MHPRLVSVPPASTSEPPRVAVPTSAPPPKASTTFQWPTLIFPILLRRPRARDEPSRAESPPLTVPAVLHRSARFPRAPSRTTSPSTSSAPPRARLCCSPAGIKADRRIRHCCSTSKLYLAVELPSPTSLRSNRVAGELLRAPLFLPSHFPALLRRRAPPLTAACSSPAALACALGLLLRARGPPALARPIPALSGRCPTPRRRGTRRRRPALAHRRPPRGRPAALRAPLAALLALQLCRLARAAARPSSTAGRPAHGRRADRKSVV